MLHRTWRRAGSYVLTERLVADWWQPFYRDDLHKRAKDRLQDALRIAEAAGHHDEASAQDILEAHGAPSLFEINSLVATFTAAHNVEDLSAALQYVHEQLGQSLTPYHYHALLRTFSYQYDRDSALQLLSVMTQRDDMTLETYARAMDMLHCMAPADVLPRLLTVVALAQGGFQTLVQVTDAAGSERATATAFGPGDAFDAAIADPFVMPGESRPAERVSGASSSQTDEPVESPVLTALLHHVANSGTCSPIAALLVAVWMRALGAALTDWDVALVLSSLLSKTEDHPRVRAVTGYFAASPRGTVSPKDFLDRLEERGELAPPSAPLCALAEAMRTSLSSAKVNMEQPIAVGVVNTQTTSLEGLVAHILNSVGQSGVTTQGSDSPFASRDPSQIYHYVMLLHGTMKSYTAAVQILTSALEREARTEVEQAAEAERAERRGGPGNHGSDDDSDTKAPATPFTVDFHFLMDGGAMMPLTSATERNAVAEPYRRAAKQVAQAAREDALRAATEEAVSTPSTLAARAVSLATPPRYPSLVDATNCEGYALLFLRTTEDARQALANTLGAIEPGTARLPRTARFALRQLVHFCLQHPRVNSKLTATGLAERRKWARYLDARDTALSLFGSAQQARDVMRQLFYEDTTMPALRSAEVVTRDVVDMTKILFPGLAQSASRGSGSAAPVSRAAAATVGGEDAEGAGSTSTALTPVEATALLVQNTFVEPRATVPHLRCQADVVPRYLYDPDVFNPYPQVMLSLPTHTHPGVAAESSEEGDFFAEVWQSIVNPAASGHGDLHWYVQDTDMYLLLMRCLIHRLDWEAAVHLTTKMMSHNTYTHRMDHEVTRMFAEAGDPTGFLAFKVATKLFDGRILRDGQGKRGSQDPMEESI